MKSALKTLGRIKKFELDNQRRLLVVELEKLDALQTNLGLLTEQYNKEKDFIATNPTLCDFGAYTKQYLKKKSTLEKQIAETEQKIENIRDVMADMFKEQKTFDIVEKMRQEKKQKDFDSQEQKMLDEIGTNAYIKNHPQ